MIEALAFPFMQKALLAAMVTGSVCAVLSCFLVLKGWSLMGDAISHAVLPGVVLAYLVGLPLIIGEGHTRELALTGDRAQIRSAAVEVALEVALGQLSAK